MDSMDWFNCYISCCCIELIYTDIKLYYLKMYLQKINSKKQKYALVTGAGS